MSLKTIHILFITASTLLAFGFAAWGLYRRASGQGGPEELWLGVGSAICGVALIFYGRYFWKKLKKVDYL